MCPPRTPPQNGLSPTSFPLILRCIPPSQCHAMLLSRRKSRSFSLSVLLIHAIIACCSIAETSFVPLPCRYRYRFTLDATTLRMPEPPSTSPAYSLYHLISQYRVNRHRNNVDREAITWVNSDCIPLPVVHDALSALSNQQQLCIFWDIVGPLL